MKNTIQFKKYALLLLSASFSISAMNKQIVKGKPSGEWIELTEFNRKDETVDLRTMHTENQQMLKVLSDYNKQLDIISRRNKELLLELAHLEAKMASAEQRVKMGTDKTT